MSRSRQPLPIERPECVERIEQSILFFAVYFGRRHETPKDNKSHQLGLTVDCVIFMKRVLQRVLPPIAIFEHNVSTGWSAGQKATVTTRPSKRRGTFLPFRAAVRASPSSFALVRQRHRRDTNRTLRRLQRTLYQKPSHAPIALR